MPDDGRVPLGHLIPVMDPVAAAERQAAELKRYEECVAAGMSHKQAQLEAIGAGAEQRRVQLGLPAKADHGWYVPPKERLRFDKQGRLIPLKKARKARRR